MADIATWAIKDTLTYGIIQSQDLVETHKTGECRNEIGQVIRVQQYDKEYQGTVTIVTTGELPKVGDTIKVNDKDLYISSIEEIENNQNFQTARISCKGTKKITSIEKAKAE